MGYDPKIVLLPGAKLSPEVVLHRTLDKLDSIKAVVIVVQWSDDTLDVDWSQMKVSEVALAALMLQREATRLMVGDMPEAIYEPPAS